eukprot:8583572-Alexandrium_andersonii.AAC.1
MASSPSSPASDMMIPSPICESHAPDWQGFNQRRQQGGIAFCAIAPVHSEYLPAWTTTPYAALTPYNRHSDNNNENTDGDQQQMRRWRVSTAC